MEKITDYMICGSLDAPKRFLGMSADVSVPLVVIFLTAFLMRAYILGIILAVLWYVSVTGLKRKFGSHVLMVMLYRNTTKSVGEIFFRKFPDSAIRYWW
jgi:type IV conjugative transfer system protein TraL